MHQHERVKGALPVSDKHIIRMALQIGHDTAVSDETSTLASLSCSRSESPTFTPFVTSSMSGPATDLLSSSRILPRVYGKKAEVGNTIEELHLAGGNDWGQSGVATGSCSAVSNSARSVSSATSSNSNGFCSGATTHDLSFGPFEQTPQDAKSIDIHA